jgi:hypothetical protein
MPLFHGVKRRCNSGRLPMTRLLKIVTVTDEIVVGFLAYGA